MFKSIKEIIGERNFIKEIRADQDQDQDTKKPLLAVLDAESGRVIIRSISKEEVRALDGDEGTYSVLEKLEDKLGFNILNHEYLVGNLSLDINLNG